MLSATLDLEANPFLATLKRVDNAVSGLHGRIVTFGAAFSGIQAAASMVTGAFEKLKGTIDLGGELNDLRSETGQTVTDLLVFRQMLSNVRLGAEGIGPFIAKWQKALAGVNEEGKPTTKVLEDLGIASDKVVNMGLLDQVALLGQRFRAIEDPAKRAAMAQALFGKSGTKSLAFLMDPEAIGQSRTQVGGLAATMEKLAPTLDTIGDAVGGITLKFQQLTAGALAVVAPEALTLADALNRLDLTGIGTAIGYVALGFIQLVEVLKPLVPVVLSLGAGWLASMASVQVASVGIVGAVQAVTVATVTGVRAMMASLGPIGIAVAALTFLWLKFRKSTGEKVDFKMPKLPETPALEAKQNPLGNAPVGSLTRVGLNAFGGNGGIDPAAARVDRSNAILEQIRDHVARANRPNPATRAPVEV